MNAPYQNEIFSNSFRNIYRSLKTIYSILNFLEKGEKCEAKIERKTMEQEFRKDNEKNLGKGKDIQISFGKKENLQHRYATSISETNQAK